jgi:hypothetical protein
METKTLTDAQLAAIARPLPEEAIKPHPTKSYLSSRKAIYVTERLNEVFGTGVWQLRTDIAERANNGMVVVKATFSVPSYDIYYECFGGNDNGGENSKNFDLGDAYKGATTDAITKIGSWLGIGADVFKGKVTPASRPNEGAYRKATPATPPQPTVPDAIVDAIIQCADIPTLQGIWTTHKHLQGVPDFIKLVNKRKAELKNEQTNS